jgi:hypothetical protein
VDCNQSRHPWRFLDRYGEAGGGHRTTYEEKLMRKNSSTNRTEEQAVQADDPDIFSDLSKLRLSQDFHKQIGVKKALVRVPVRKPHKQEFIRVRPEPEYRLETGLLELKEDREFYLLDPEVRDQLPGDWSPVRIVTCINRQGVVFLWPLKLPDLDGRANSWAETAVRAADLATRQWLKLVADMALGGYQSYLATGELPEPEWPEYAFKRLLAVAFRDHIIRDMEHPVIARLLGSE